MRHRVYRLVVEAIKAGRLCEPFGCEEFKNACPGFGAGTYNAFLHKHAVGNPGEASELFERVQPGRFRLMRPIKYGLG